MFDPLAVSNALILCLGGFIYFLPHRNSSIFGPIERLMSGRRLAFRQAAYP